MRHDATADDDAYGENLRFCCDHYKSISAVCRQLDFNRQQFNKYINGQSRPSRYNHRRISDFFGLDYHELMMPHDAFVSMMTAKTHTPAVPEFGLHVASHVTNLLAADAHETKAYSGFYYKYFHSMTEPSMIKRDLCHFHMKSGILCTSTKERVEPGAVGRAPTGLLSYRGMIALLGGRIFWIECDRELQSEVTLSIVFPSPTKIISRLEGIVLGTGLDRSRRIVASRVVLEFLGRTIDGRHCLSQVGIFDGDSPAIEPDIRDLLNAPIPDEESVLQKQSWE